MVATRYSTVCYQSAAVLITSISDSCRLCFCNETTALCTVLHTAVVYLWTIPYLATLWRRLPGLPVRRRRLHTFIAIAAVCKRDRLKLCNILHAMWYIIPQAFPHAMTPTYRVTHTPETHPVTMYTHVYVVCSNVLQCTLRQCIDNCNSEKTQQTAHPTSKRLE